MPTQEWRKPKEKPTGGKTSLFRIQPQGYLSPNLKNFLPENSIISQQPLIYEMGE